MSGLPSTGVGEEGEDGLIGVPATAPGLWLRARQLVGQKLSYALGDQVVYSFGNMVVAALLSRHTPQREFGIYILTQRAIDVVLQLCNVFFWAPYIYNLPSTGETRKRQYLGSVTAHQLVACALAAAAMLALKHWAHTPERGIYYGVFAPLVLTSAGIVFREFTRRMYFSEMRFREAFWAEVATVLLQIAGVLWLQHTGRLTVSATLWVLSLGAIVVSLWWVAREWRKFVFDVSAFSTDFRQNLKLGRWFFGSNMVFMASSQCNPWVLSATLGGASVGAYAVCESVVNIPRVAVTSLQNMMAPMMARTFASGGKPALAALVKRLDRMLLVGSAVCAAGIVAFGPWVSQLIFHSAYTREHTGEARFLLTLLALNFVAFAARLAQSFGLTAINRAGETFYASLAGLLAQVSVLLWLVRALHVPGAAAAMLIGTLCVVAVRTYFYRREIATA